MVLGFLLHKEHKDLAVAEIKEIVGAKGLFHDDFYVVKKDFQDFYSRLAYTKKIYELDKNFEKKKLIIDLNKHNQFSKRRSHLLPFGHPAMTHPRLARAMINISGAKKGVLDPFCGGGGILIEAFFCKLDVAGFDIDLLMLKRTKTNLNHFGISTGNIKLHDATTFTGSFETIVTDLPYGKNTIVKSDLVTLFTSFFQNALKNNIKKLVVGFPDSIDYKKIISLSPYKIKQEFTYYLHKSLSKKIVVMDLNS